MNNIALKTTSTTDSTAQNAMYIKLIDAVKERPEVFVGSIALVGLTLIALKYIDAKYNHETTISYTPNEGFKYVSKSVTVNNSIVCSK